MVGPRRLNEPRPVAVRAADDGTPRAVGPVALRLKDADADNTAITELCK